LIESVEWRDIEAQLKALPKMAMADPAFKKDQIAEGRRLLECRMTKKASICSVCKQQVFLRQ